MTWRCGDEAWALGVRRDLKVVAVRVEEFLEE
jgi:hypothetical protein